MKVKAIKQGYYDLKRRNVGEVFILHDKKVFSNSWMKALDEKKSSKSKAAKPLIEGEIESSSLSEDVI